MLGPNAFRPSVNSSFLAKTEPAPSSAFTPSLQMSRVRSKNDGSCGLGLERVMSDVNTFWPLVLVITGVLNPGCFLASPGEFLKVLMSRPVPELLHQDVSE